MENAPDLLAALQKVVDFVWDELRENPNKEDMDGSIMNRLIDLQTDMLAAIAENARRAQRALALSRFKCDGRSYMGADRYVSRASGKDAKEAFGKAVDAARYDHGHRGYTGTIAEKSEFIMLKVPEGETPGKFVERVLCGLCEEDDPQWRQFEEVNDKWGASGCIEIDRGAERPEERDGQRQFIFFGWASS